MSVLIRGMEMPKSCMECRLCAGSSGILCKALSDWIDDYNGYAPADRRDDRCPLVEVKTPHGRLIDESSIKYDSEAVRCMDDGHIWHELCVCKDVIDDLPTVLESEE